MHLIFLYSLDNITLASKVREGNVVQAKDLTYEKAYFLSRWLKQENKTLKLKLFRRGWWRESRGLDRGGGHTVSCDHSRLCNCL